MGTLGQRIKERRNELGYSQERLAELVHVTQGLIGQIESGRNKGSTHLVPLAQALKCSAEWLATGKGDRLAQMAQQPAASYGTDYVPVKRVHFKLSAGISGFEIEYMNGDRAPIFFRHDWLNSRGLDSRNLFAVEINGKSMEPSLFEGDLVVVNTGDAVPTDGDVFALNYDGELVIKRLVRDGDAWYMRSDNQDKIRYADKRCDERTSVIGRIVHKQSERI